MAGYSATPLPKKLGIKEGARLVVTGEAPAMDSLLAELPDAVTQGRRLVGSADVVLFFVVRRARIEERIDQASRVIFPDGGLWICWPKRASGVATDMTEDVVREVGLPMGLVDNKVCAIDETWSGLRMVWRRERRTLRPD